MSDIYTTNTLRLDMAHTAAIAAASRIHADVRRNIGQAHAATLLESAAMLIEESVQNLLSLSEQEALRAVHNGRAMAEETAAQARRSTFHVVQPPVPAKPKRTRKTGRSPKAEP